MYPNVPPCFRASIAIWKNGRYKSVFPVDATDQLINNRLLSSEIFEELTYGGLRIITSKHWFCFTSSILSILNSNEFAWYKFTCELTSSPFKTQRRFNIIQSKYKPFTPGYVKKDFKTRGGADYRLDAILDIYQFTQIIIHRITY